MSRFVIHGKSKISGTLRPVGNKNAALPMMAACLLTDETVRLTQVPDIEDVRVTLHLLEDLGVSCSFEKHTVTLCAKGLRKTRLDSALCRQVRSSILLAGPLTARHGQAVLAPPGGDVIGRRRVDTHFQGLAALGITIKSGGQEFRFSRDRLRGAYILLDEASVTATENIMMAACMAPGKTTIYNAACEPHVQNLGRLLNAMGADISGLGANRLEIRGVRRLHGATQAVEADFIEIGSYLCAAVATGGALRIPVRGKPAWLPVLDRGFARLGVKLDLSPTHIACDARHAACPAPPVYRDDIPKIEDGVWPAFPSDLMSVAIVMATQLPATILFFEKLFESRMYFVDHLISMGARIVVCDPHRVVVSGPARLRAAHMSSPDIRAGMALIIAALCAEGESVIENAQVVDRGYEYITQRLQALGADIRRED
ncbi:MAG: UDP-N-acetylglucosamine 1-carboxyvinyltransferase [Spartobacteria bacterium]|nr:UDP-N-acetylglucosamine 1-carboxyvinyltransferase [Spartobacteria bacterium]